MDVYLYRKVPDSKWQLMPELERLPKGEYLYKGPYSLEKACFLKEIFDLWPVFAGRKRHFISSGKGRKRGSPKGVWRVLKNPDDINYGDSVKPGITGLLRWRCSICGSLNIDTEKCPFCGRDNCLICKDCQMMQTIRSCQFYLWQKPTPFPPLSTEIVPLIPFELTEGQKNAARKLKRLLASGKKKLLLHAACGAGKTEVASLLIAEALKKGLRVLYAVPRKDVAKEIGDRLREYFPKTEIVILYGESPERYYNQRLVAATTHQVVRFSKTFNLTILDEGDAFPYRGNQKLESAIERATDGALIYMTATPTEAMLEQFKADEIVFISARHHRRALPVPKFSSLGLERVIEDAKPPLLLFVPFKKQVARTVKDLQSLKKNWQIAGVSSETKGREALIRGLKEGKLHALVCTSVLERGITVNGVFVIVKDADCAAIYTKEVLVQIAGRAGRTVKCPDGEVIFLARRPNRLMKEAKKEIEALNAMAKKRGEITC